MHPKKNTTLLDDIKKRLYLSKLYIYKKRIEIIKFLPFFYQPFLSINTLELKTLIDDQFIS